MSSETIHRHWPDRRIDLLHFKPADVDFAHIATALSRIPRFAGGTREPLSVAQHSVKVLDLCSPEAKPYALLHQAHEAYTGDPTASFLNLFLRVAGKSQSRTIAAAWRRATGMLDAAIFAAAGLKPTMSSRIAEEIAAADLQARGEEIDRTVVGRAGIPFRFMTAAAARQEFIQALRQVTGIIVE